MSHDVSEFYASRSAPRRPSPLVRALRTVTRLILPVVGLVGVLMGADAVTDVPVTFLDGLFPAGRADLEPSNWLTYGHLALGIVFFMLNLTNRRYGAAYAVAQMTIVWFIAVGLAYAFFAQMSEPLLASPLPSARTGSAFVFALAASQLLNILVFEWTRGRPWWRAPLYASMWGSVLLCVVFYPTAYAGTDVAWTSRMMTYMGVLTAMAVVLLVPYFLLRRLIRPLPGFGGA